MKSPICLALAIALAIAPQIASAKAGRSGYLCCNMQMYNDWISDINYRFDGTRLLRAGTRIRVVEKGGNYATVRIGGKDRYLGNDYSRTLPEKTFLRRYIVATDPRKKLEQYDQFTRDAITNLKVMPGMTEEQVAMSIGYPVANYTPSIRRRVWQYWLDRSSRMDIHWDKDRRVKRVSGEWSVVSRVLYTPGTDIVEQVQSRLNAMQIDAGEVDGLMGPQTRRAIADYQKQQQLPNKSGILDVVTLARLGFATGAGGNRLQLGSPATSGFADQRRNDATAKPGGFADQRGNDTMTAPAGSGSGSTDTARPAALPPSGLRPKPPLVGNRAR